jgi:DNA-binding transcriptional LysR family regulator
MVGNAATAPAVSGPASRLVTTAAATMTVAAAQVSAVVDHRRGDPGRGRSPDMSREREAGAKLLRRAGRNVELTAAGRRLAAYAADALAADESIRAELSSAGNAPGGRLRITFVQTTALALLPGVLERLAAAAPDLQVEVVQRETAPALDDLRSRAVDLVVGIEYDPVPVPRQRDIDRLNLLREDVLLALHPEHPALPRRGPARLAACESAAWATGHRGTGLDAVVRNVCNRLGGFEPDVRHRSDDGLVLSALVASGRAVALLPALLTTTMRQMTARRLREERLQRTIFTATRTAAAEAPAVLAARAALRDTARRVASRQRDLEVLA